jgi:hypothetical protein
MELEPFVAPNLRHNSSHILILYQENEDYRQAMEPTKPLGEVFLRIKTGFDIGLSVYGELFQSQSRDTLADRKGKWAGRLFIYTPIN